MKKKDEIQVHCPFCNNKRLFDITDGTEGIIKIKCSNCKLVAVIRLSHVSEETRGKRIRAYNVIAKK